MSSLVVTSGFVPYPIGTVITDQTLITTILAGENALDVVSIISTGTTPFISAPSVAGLIVPGTSVITGTFWNGTPTALAYSLNSTAPVAVVGPVIIGQTYSFSIATPPAGALTIQVIGTAGNLAASSLTFFTVSASRTSGGAAIISGHLDGSGHTIILLSDGSTVDLGVLLGVASRLVDDSGNLLADDFGSHLIAS